MPPKVIYGPRQSGKTSKLINLCKMHNDTYGSNHTVIMAKNRLDAFRIADMAHEIGYSNMPFPVTYDEIKDTPPTHYKEILIDDMDVFVQNILRTWKLAGYTISSENFLNELSEERSYEE